MAEENQENTAKNNDKKSRIALYIIAIIPTIAMVSFFLVTKVINPRVNPAAADTTETPVENVVAKTEETFLCELGTVLANPSGGNSRRIMKMGISLEVSSKKMIEGVEKIKPKLQHQLIIILSSKDLDLISSAEGKSSLQEEIKTAFSELLDSSEGSLLQVYFSEFVVQ
ncbi:hypothetical protein GF312_06995 [Candidatus Poribacteria bacterium]|nr:hypothetical protein [Candidatus Poribacteria bacterium]